MMRTLSINQNIPLYNSRIIDSYIKLIRRNYSYININELLHYAKMTSYEVADQGHWFTQEQINLFHEKLAQLVNHDNIAREAGRYSASPDALGIMRKYILGMVGPEKIYLSLANVAANFTKHAKYESHKLAPNKFEVIISLHKNVQEKPFQCENRIGTFESISLAFTNKLPSIEHDECVHRGHKRCRYIIEWERSMSVLCKKIRNFITLFLFGATIALGLYNPASTLPLMIPLSISIIFILTLISSGFEKKELSSSLNHLKDSTDQLLSQTEAGYNNARLTNEIGHALSRLTKLGEILQSTVQIFKKRLDYDRCMILLVNKDKKRLEFKTGFGYTFDQLKILKDAAFNIDRPDSRGIFVIALRKQKPYLINDINQIEEDLSPRSLTFAKKLGTQAFICCPIISDGQSIGILAVDNLRSKKPLIKSDVSLLMGIASVLGISIRNAELLEAKEKQFKSLLQVLAASIDARDPMTSGHSEKVTEYSMGVCEELGLDDEQCEVIRVAALLHDYGKIGVPDSILKKRGKLNEEEYEIVKNHVDKTKRILKQVSFEGIFSEVPDIAGAHHERYDGAGYPKGLKGKEIPLGARIIAAADFFDAITSKRPYRDPMSLKKAINMLINESGKKLDKKIVEAFIRYYMKFHAADPAYRMTLVKLMHSHGSIDLKSPPDTTST